MHNRVTFVFVATLTIKFTATDWMIKLMAWSGATEVNIELTDISGLCTYGAVYSNCIHTISKGSSFAESAQSVPH